MSYIFLYSVLVLCSFIVLSVKVVIRQVRKCPLKCCRKAGDKRCIGTAVHWNFSHRSIAGVIRSGKIHGTVKQSPCKFWVSTYLSSVWLADSTHCSGLRQQVSVLAKPEAVSHIIGKVCLLPDGEPWYFTPVNLLELCLPLVSTKPAKYAFVFYNCASL